MATSPVICLGNRRALPVFIAASLAISMWTFRVRDSEQSQLQCKTKERHRRQQTGADDASAMGDLEGGGVTNGKCSTARTNDRKTWREREMTVATNQVHA